jgi:hypothetical protein
MAIEHGETMSPKRCAIVRVDRVHVLSSVVLFFLRRDGARAVAVQVMMTIVVKPARNNAELRIWYFKVVEVH